MRGVRVGVLVQNQRERDIRLLLEGGLLIRDGMIPGR